MGEVDQFLDEVEAGLTRLTKENDELRSKLRPAAARGAPPRPAGEAAREEARARASRRRKSRSRSRRRSPSPRRSRSPKPAAQGEDGDHPGHHHRRRLARRDPSARAHRPQRRRAGRRGPAGGRPDPGRGQGRGAERVQEETSSSAKRSEEEAHERAQALDAETAERRQQLMGDLESEKSGLDEEVTRLQEFEKSYRQELRDYFQQQLQSLEGATGRLPPPRATASSPRDRRAGRHELTRPAHGPARTAPPGGRGRCRPSWQPRVLSRGTGP